MPGDTIPSRLDPITMAQDLLKRPNTYYPILNPATGLWYPCSPLRVWSIWSRRKPTKKKNAGPPMEELIQQHKIFFPAEMKTPYYYETKEDLLRAIDEKTGPRDGKGRPLLRNDLPDVDFWIGKPIAHGRPSYKTFVAESSDVRRPLSSWIASSNDPKPDDELQTIAGERQGVGTDAIMKIFGEKVFDFPKPPGLITRLLQSATSDDDIVLDFFAGSGTTGEATLRMNDADDGDRRFILVSNAENTAESPERNLCRDVCAERIRRAITGSTTTAAVPGDFAYLRARRVPWDDVVYDLAPEVVWTMVQLRYDRPLLPFAAANPVQVSFPADTDPEAPAVVYVPSIDDAAVDELRDIATRHMVVAYCAVPDLLRDRLGLAAVAIKQVPDRLLADFPRVVAGL